MTAQSWEVLLKAAAGGGVIVLLYWLLRAVFIPERRCWWCKGSGRSWWSTEERKGRCLFCGGNPWRMTFGARLVRGQVRLFRSSRWGK